MTEKLLRDYFESKITAELLNEDLEGNRVKTGYDTSTVYGNQIQSEKEFLINTSHLLKLCEDCIEELISAENLKTIAFALICSEYFIWDENTPEGKVVDETIHDWDNPNINFELTKENLKLWKKYLQTGEYQLE